jgi:glycosyltransferase involved in cell wall biosynthesis
VTSSAPDAPRPGAGRSAGRAPSAAPEDDRPSVSVCIPTRNGSRTIEEAIRSATAQTFRDLEIVVVDGGSTDDTVAIARSVADPRVRVVVTGRDDGMVANWNRAVQLARGRYIKLLFQDDQLDASCVELMLGVFERHPSVGLVFSRRSIVVDGPADDATRRWLELNQDVHRHLGPLAECNPGRPIVMRHAAAAFRSNRIGEPSCVMMARRAIERVGAFNTRMRQVVDLEMWLRILYHDDAGFVDRPLATFRLHGTGATAGNLARGVGWLDRLWLVEGMLAVPGLTSEDRRAFRRLRRPIWAAIIRHEAWRLRHGARPSLVADGGSLGAYLAYRGDVLLRRPATLHGSVVDGHG